MVKSKQRRLQRNRKFSGQAHIVFVSNPFEPFKDTETHAVNLTWRKVTIRSWLKRRFPRFKDFTRPTICLVNGHPLKRAQWGRRLRPDDVVNFVAVAGDPITVLWVVTAAIAVASVAIALSIKIPTNLTGDTPGADPTYSLKGQRNQVRLGMPIEVPYGKPRQWPSYCAQAYNQYIDNKQWLFQLFCLGQGECTIHDINIEDTPIADFQDVEWEVIPPGSPVTLFPTNVVTSAEVQGIELLGTNEGALNGTQIEDSEGDAGEGIDPTEHIAYSSAGPFVLNPSGTQTDRIEVDVQLPRGLYTQANDGTLNNFTVTALFEIQEIDNGGTPIGAWTTPAGFNWSLTRNTITPQRYTLGADVTLGRYRIRASRTNAKDTSSKTGNQLIWEAARAFIPEDTVDAGVTRLAVKARASNNLNDNSASRVNVVATWHRPVWNGATWTTQPTRSPVWAFCDVFRATYGARLADQYLNLSALAALDLVLADREEYFDWIFEQKTTCWDVARTIAAVGRAVPMLEGSRINAIRDDVKTFPVAIFSHENIVKDSFRQEIKLAELNPYDGLVIVYTDPVTWKEESVLCCLDDEAGNNPETRKVVGITGRAHAYHLGMYWRAYDRYVRESFGFSTGMEGHIPSFGDMVAASHDVPRWNNGGMIKSLNKVPAGPNFQYYFELLPQEDVTAIVGTHYLLVRKNDGSVIGPLQVVLDSTNVVVYTGAANADLDAILFDGIHEKPVFLFGPSNLIGKNIVINGLAGNEEDEVEVTGRPYDARLFAKDDATPPAIGETHGHLPDRDALPAVSGLRVVGAPINTIDGGVGVSASWFAMPGATSYLVQYSYDAKNWNDVGETKDLNMNFTVALLYLYVRVAALNTAQGDWAYWTGDAPIYDVTQCVAPTSLAVASAGYVVIQPDGTAVPRVRLGWTKPADELVKAEGFVRIQYKLAADADLPANWVDWGTVQGSQEFDFVDSVKTGISYNFRIRSENKFGGFSAWVTPAAGAHTVIGDTSTPNAVPNSVAAVAFPGYIEITWVRSASVNVNEYKVYRNTVNNPGTAVKIGETDTLWFDDSGVVGGLTPGQLYYYWIVPVSGSDVDGGTHATPATATAATAPLGAAVPSAPTAPTIQSNGTYTDSAGRVSAFAVVRIQALPANAVWQNVLLRVNGATSDWQIYNTAKNTSGNYDVRVDDLSPGVNYDVAVQAWSGAGGSAVTQLGAPGYFTAASKGNPVAPASITVVGPSTSLSVPPYYDSNKTQWFAAQASWPASTDKDTVAYEWTISSAGNDAGADTAWGLGVGRRVATLQDFVYIQALVSSYVSVRAVNSTGNRSSWRHSATNLTSVVSLAAGTLSQQNANAVAVTAIKTGGSGAREIAARYVESVVVSIAGGSPSEDFAINISGRGFSTKPDDGRTPVVGASTGDFRDLGATYVYDHGSNSSSTAYVTVFRLDGGNLAAEFVRLSIEFIEYN